MKLNINGTGAGWSKDVMQAMLKDIETWGPIAVGVGGVLVALTSLLLSHFFNRRLLKEKQIEEERREIYKKLNSFYGPVLQLLKQSRDLYEMFTANRHKDFSTLIALLEGQEFSGNDNVLLTQIFEVTEKIEDLMYTNSGLVEDKELRDLLAQAGSHFRLLRLAYHGELEGEPERFKDRVFSRELEPKVEQQTRKLEARLDELNGRNAS